MKFAEKISDQAVDRLYVWLALFTSCYIALITFEFFTGWHHRYPSLEQFLDAVKDPYLAILATYVVLKEIRKHHRHPHFLVRHGEYFVWIWTLLLFVSTIAVAGTEYYRFDVAYSLMLSNTLTSLALYLGSQIHKD